MKTKLIKKGILLMVTVITFLFVTTITTSAQSKYGGSAYAHTKDNEGKTRVINTTKQCMYDNESKAKSELEYSLKSLLQYGEQLSSSITYSINSCSTAKSNTKYGGSASARVKDYDGKTRSIDTTKPCIYENEAKAKSELEYTLKSLLQWGEDLDSPITYDIDSCN